jgi:catechol 2,3-dioxygenase-like lactoylglutathione lyase family enzyme
MITGINHINIAVKDIEVSFRFYKEVLGFTPLCKSEGSAYFLVGIPDKAGCLWFSLDLDRDHVRLPAPCNSHIAFSVSEEAFESLSARILTSGMQRFKENSSPGSSLYFLDPDGHKLEIHVGNWRTRIEAKKANPGNWKNVEWFI